MVLTTPSGENFTTPAGEKLTTPAGEILTTPAGENFATPAGETFTNPAGKITSCKCFTNQLINKLLNFKSFPNLLRNYKRFEKKQTLKTFFYT